MTKRAVLVGINYIGSNAELRGCIDDIADVQHYLLARKYTEFTVLCDDDSYSSILPTGANIRKALHDAVSKMIAGDTLYVHYSGHGAQLPTSVDNKHIELDGFDECICPSDFCQHDSVEQCHCAADDYGFIRDNELRKLLVDNLPVDCKLRAVFDACHSGSMLDLPYRYAESECVFLESFGEDSLDKDIVLISGCKDNECSADAEFNGRANGALTHALLATLKSVRRNVTWRELIDKMRQILKAGGYEQNPQLDVANLAQMISPLDL